MMRSLWSGVSGLQAHQIAMDVEGHNIANVNTFGYKFARANFSDMLSQTAKVATGPQGNLGGQNPMQIGLGTNIDSTTRIFHQGSVQTTKKPTDLAIKGDGFFVLSPDGGRTYRYTRNGDFLRDAQGNLVDNNGYIVQGWLRNQETGVLDSSAPIRNIIIPPGLTSPAKATSEITLKANLNSGSHVENHKPIYQLDSHTGWVDKNGDGLITGTELHRENDVSDNEFDVDGNLIERAMDMGVLFNESGDAFNLRRGQGMWVSYANAKATFTLSRDGNDPVNVSMTLNGTSIVGSATSFADIANLINAQTAKTGVEAQIVGTNQLELINTNRQGTEANMKNIKFELHGAGDAGNPGDAGDRFNGLATTNVITAYQYTYDPNPVTADHQYNDGIQRRFNTTEDLREAMQKDARLWTNYNGTPTDNDPVTPANAWIDAADPTGIRATTSSASNNINDGISIEVNKKGQFEIKNPKSDAFNFDDGDIIRNGQQITTNYTFRSGITYPQGVFQNNTGSSITIPAGVFNNPLNGTPPGTDIVIANGATFPPAPDPTTGGTLTANKDFTIEIVNGHIEGTMDAIDNNPDDQDAHIQVTALTNATNGISENVRLTKVFDGMSGIIPIGNSVRASQSIHAASAGASEDVFDSLGSKHTLQMSFTKIGYTDDGGTEWSVLYKVPEPGVINYSGDGPKNVVTGMVRFGPNGALSAYTPTNLTYTANNGSSPNQNVELDFGTLGEHDGLTSYDDVSSVSNISGNGYTGGEFYDLRINQAGIAVVTFSNGQKQAYAQVAMAKFTNNSGLESEGGNVFSKTSNSGDAVIGAAGTGGRGTIQSSAIEMSNVDLSHSLTQLIVVQRGFQANSKTITTSDQMLNTLLQLKQ